MALVAYDDSGSESENEEVEESGSKVIILNRTPGSSLVSNVANVNNRNTANRLQQDMNAPLFTHLPQPTENKSQSIVEEDDEFLKKKEEAVERPRKIKQPVRIGITALSDFISDDEDDEPQNKRAKNDLNAGGLFALLPPPKGAALKNTSFVPNVLQKKGAGRKQVKPTKILQKPKVNLNDKVNETIKAPKEDDEDDDIEVPETFDDDIWQKICGRQKRPAKPEVQRELPTEHEEEILMPMVESAPEVEKPYTGLDNQAFKELVGTKRKPKINIELIDIHEDEIRPDREEWLKSLTDPNCEAKTEIKDPVNNTCKVKNHITALAQKALANDKELQQRWAESRYNRRQTQAKYGF